MIEEKSKTAGSIEQATLKAGKVLSQPERVNHLLQASKNKLNKLELQDGDFKSILGTIRTFIRMLKAFRRGQYEIPWTTVLMIVAALIYFVMPLDMMPDFIPAAGYIDDFAVVMAIFKKVQKDVDSYQSWEQGSQDLRSQSSDL